MGSCKEVRLTSLPELFTKLIVILGTNADNVLADAFVKDLPGVNWTDAYQAMLKNAEVPPYNQYNAMDLSGDIQQGRGALGDWKNLGYIAADHHTRSVSRTMEYAQNDYALTVLSRGLITGDYAKYLRRAAQWQNIWNIDAEYNSFTGFIAPRMRDGTWRDNPYYYSPAVCDDLCGWTDIAYEATPFGKSPGSQRSLDVLTDVSQSTRLTCHTTWRHSSSSWAARKSSSAGWIICSPLRLLSRPR